MSFARPSHKGFMLGLVASTVLHVGIGGAFLYAKTRKPERPAVNFVPVQLVKLGKKRDPNLLPRMVAPPPPPKDEGVALDKSADANAKPVDKKPRPKHKSDKDLDKALNRLTQDRKLDEHLKPEEAEGDPEGSIYGTTTDPTNAAKGYAVKVIEAFHQSYRLPEAIPAAERRFLQADVLLKIDRDGTILEHQFVQAHPNQLFMNALEGLIKTVKLPPPPPVEADNYRENGVLIRFKP